MGNWKGGGLTADNEWKEKRPYGLSVFGPTPVQSASFGQSLSLK